MTDAMPRRPPTRRLAPALLAASIVAVLGSTQPSAAGAFDLAPTDSANRLDHPVVDLALLDVAGPDGAPRLLVVDAVPPTPGVERVSILQRDRAWSEVSSLDVPADDAVGTPWLIGLTPSRFALLATSLGDGATQVTLLDTVAGPGGAELAIVATGHVPLPIDDAGAADVDGDGTAELVLSSARTLRQGGTCQGSRLFILDGTSLAARAPLDVAETRLGGAVIGRFDDVPGDDLLAYGYGNCPAGPDSPDDARLLTVRLADGTTTDRDAIRGDAAPWLGSPLRLDLDGTGTHEAIGQGEDGLTIFDPAHDWHTSRIGIRAVPLVAGPAEPDVGARIGWMAPNAAGQVASATIFRAADASIGTSATISLQIGSADDARGQAIVGQVLTDATAQVPSVAWAGTLGEPGCTDLILPGARLSCDDAVMRTGAAWLGTRPVSAIGEGSRRRLLVAGGLEWSLEDGLPRTPAPWATAPPGWWRHGPSVPFSLAELRAGDATYFQEFPEPRATLMQTTEADASTTIPGFTGARIFARVSPEADDVADPMADVPPGAPDAVLVPHGLADRLTVLRIPVPPGLESGRDGSGVRLPLAEVTFEGGERADRWIVGLVAVNDWGEIGTPVAGAIVRDAIGPFVTLEPPFTTPVWPLSASLPGTVEPGATVEVDGIGPIEADRRGRFSIQTPLAPWPQTMRITATDPSGNETVREISVIGGVDYRRFPWEMIGAVAVLVAVGVSGVVGSRRRRSGEDAAVPVARGRGAFYDDGPVAEIEELPPGAGLA